MKILQDGTEMEVVDPEEAEAVSIGDQMAHPAEPQQAQTA